MVDVNGYKQMDFNEIVSAAVCVDINVDLQSLVKQQPNAVDESPTVFSPEGLNFKP